MFTFIETNYKTKDKGRLIAAICVIILSISLKFIPFLNEKIKLLGNIYNFFNNFFWIVLLLMGCGTVISIFLIRDKFKCVELTENEIILYYKNGSSMNSLYSDIILNTNKVNGSLDINFGKGKKIITFYPEDWNNYDLFVGELHRSINKE